jgi:uncharacterized protein (TIGR03435 family)
MMPVNHAILAALIATTAFGQTERQKVAPEFDVASVRLADPNTARRMRGGPGTNDPVRISFERVTLADLLEQAYNVRSDQISGPAWLRDYAASAYTVAAVMPPGTSQEQFRLMLQNLLAERFHLRLHHENQNREGYELVVPAGGNKLQQWVPVRDAEPDRQGTDQPYLPDFDKGFPTLPANAQLPVGFAVPSPSGTTVSASFRGAMTDFCRTLERMIVLARGASPSSPQPRIADRTSLSGVFELRLKFASVAGSPGPRLVEGDPGMTLASDPSGAPNIFTALEKQLGLKLQRTDNMTVDVLVVDKADKIPAEN